MLTVISDLHLSDSTASCNISEKAFNLLETEIFSQVDKYLELSRAASGIHPVREIRLVLNGDIFDFVRTTFWQKFPANERPWNSATGKLNQFGMNPDPKVENKYAELLNHIINQPATQSFINFINNTLNRANNYNPQLPVSIIYVIGNHDRVLNFYEGMKYTIWQNMPKNISIDYVNSYKNEDYGVLCRHGHQYDEHCRGNEFYNLLNNKNTGLYNQAGLTTQNIGEVQTAEFLSGIVHRIMNKSENPQLTAKIKYIDNVKPFSQIFPWLASIGSDLDTQTQNLIITSCVESLQAMLNSEFAKEWDRLRTDFIVRGDLTDYLGKALMILKTFNFENLSKISNLFEKVGRLSENTQRFTDAAQNEWNNPDMQNISYVIYGHTHKPERLIFNEDSSGKKQMYINCGHWGNSVFKTYDRNSFAMMQVMPMTFIYRTDEGRNTRHPKMNFWEGGRIES